MSWDRDWVLHIVLARKRRHHLIALIGRHTVRSQPLDAKIENRIILKLKIYS